MTAPRINEEFRAEQAARREQKKASDSAKVVRMPTQAPTPAMRVWPAPFKGSMAALVKACQKAAKRKQGSIATMGMLVAMAACIPSVYRLETDGLRCNLYGLGAAETAQGKDAVKRMALLIAAHAGAIVVGPPSSSGGFQDAVVPWRPVFAPLDEVHEYFAAGNNRKQSPHIAAAIAVMLDLYTASASMLVVRALSTDKKKRNTGEVQPPVHHPMFSFLGFSTLARLRGALTVANVEEGLMGRMLVAVGEDNSEEMLDWGTTGLAVPEDVRKVIDTLTGKAQQATATVKPSDVGCIDVVMGPGTLDRLKEMDRLDVAARKRMPAGSLARALNMRAVERVTRIAMVPAIWADPEHPAITLEMLEWAHEAALASDSNMVELIGDEGSALGSADPERKDAETVLRSIQSYAERTGQPWCDHSTLMQNTFGKKKLEPALGYLLETERIEQEQRSVFNERANRDYDKTCYRVVG